MRTEGFGKGIALAVLATAFVLRGAPDARPAGGPAQARAEEHRTTGEEPGRAGHPRGEEQAEPGAGHEHAAHKAIAGSAPLPDRSVYQIGGTWTDQGGRPFRLEGLRGHPVVVLLFYGTCKQACPILVEDLKRLDAMIAPEVRGRVRYLLVTFDPARDTPERLAAYAREHKLDPARWTLLHGAPEQVREIAMVLGVRYRPAGGGEFNHTMRITLLDREGVAVERLDGLRQPLDALATSLSRL